MPDQEQQAPEQPEAQPAQPENEGQEVAGEKQEDQALQQALALAKSGNPQALPKIAQILTALLAHNQQEEQGMGGGQPEAGGQPTTHEDMLNAVKQQMGGQG